MFVMCINNKGQEFSILLRKVYRVVRTELMGIHMFYWIKAENGVDMVFSERKFVEVGIPEECHHLF